jgi:nucleotide-binding universal stress UspA family protein
MPLAAYEQEVAHMYKKILVALDCSPADEAIVDHVIKLATVHHSEVILIRAEVEHPYGLHHNGVAKSTDYLETVRKRFEAHSIGCQTVLAKGDPARSILTNAEALGCDLIAMATHGHRAFMDFILGSVTDTVKHDARIPVLLIRKP